MGPCISIACEMSKFGMAPAHTLRRGWRTPSGLAGVPAFPVPISVIDVQLSLREAVDWDRNELMLIALANTFRQAPGRLPLVRTAGRSSWRQ